MGYESFISMRYTGFQKCIESVRNYIKKYLLPFFAVQFSVKKKKKKETLFLNGFYSATSCYMQLAA